MKRRIVGSGTEDEQPDWGMNLLHELMLLFLHTIEPPNASTKVSTSKSGNGKALTSALKIFCNIDEKVLRRRFDENIDFASTPKTFARIETHDRRLACL